MKTFICIFGLSVLLLAAQSTPPTLPPQSQPSSKASSQESNPAGDSQLSSKVRKAITDDSTLSATAHNVKVTSHGGIVTLKGKVSSSEEKDAVVAKAKEVAGSTNVKDELTVAAKK